MVTVSKVINPLNPVGGAKRGQNDKPSCNRRTSSYRKITASRTASRIRGLIGKDFRNYQRAEC